MKKTRFFIVAGLMLCALALVGCKKPTDEDKKAETPAVYNGFYNYPQYFLPLLLG